MKIESSTLKAHLEATMARQPANAHDELYTSLYDLLTEDVVKSGCQVDFGADLVAFGKALYGLDLDDIPSQMANGLAVVLYKVEAGKLPYPLSHLPLVVEQLDIEGALIAMQANRWRAARMGRQIGRIMTDQLVNTSLILTDADSDRHVKPGLNQTAVELGLTCQYPDGQVSAKGPHVAEELEAANKSMNYHPQIGWLAEKVLRGRLPFELNPVSCYLRVGPIIQSNHTKAVLNVGLYPDNYYLYADGQLSADPDTGRRFVGY